MNIKQFLKKILKLSPIPFSKNHLYDQQTKRIIKTRLTNKSNCIDVGCYKGEILDVMIKAAPEGNHYGIEPIPSLAEQLKLKYRNHDRCKLITCAAWNKRGTSTFHHIVSNPSYSGIKKRDFDRAEEKDEIIDIETRMLDEIIPNALSIELIKIDVEGAEYQVLQGAEQIISNYKPLVIFEHGMGASNHYGTSPGEIWGYFNEKNMKVSTLNSFLRYDSALSKEEFNLQYRQRLNYYFIAHI